MRFFKKIITATSVFTCVAVLQAESQCFCPPDCSVLYVAPVESSCVTFQADLLYWCAEEDNMELGVRTDGWVPITVTAPSTFDSVGMTNDHLVTPKSKYKPGFRLSLGFGDLGGGWDGAVRWTNFSSNSRVSVDAKASQIPQIAAGFGVPSSGFFPEWERFDAQDKGGVYKAHWGLSLNVLDIEWGRKSRLSDRNCIRPFLGLRLLRIDQSYQVNEKLGADVFSSTIVSLLTAYGKCKARNDFVGVGPRLGVDIDFHIGCGWEIFGEAAGSLAYGIEKLNSSEDLVVLGGRPASIRATTGGNLLYNMHNKTRRLRWNADLALGLRWSQCMESCGRVYPVALALSWEEHLFSQANQFRFDRSLDKNLFVQRSHKSGCLTTAGWTLSAFVGF